MIAKFTKNKQFFCFVLFLMNQEGENCASRIVSLPQTVKHASYVSNWPGWGQSLNGICRLCSVAVKERRSITSGLALSIGIEFLSFLNIQQLLFFVFVFLLLFLFLVLFIKNRRLKVAKTRP